MSNLNTAAQARGEKVVLRQSHRSGRCRLRCQAGGCRSSGGFIRRGNEAEEGSSTGATVASRAAAPLRAARARSALLEEEEARQRKRLAVEHRPLAPSLRYTIIAALWAIVSLARSLSVLDASLQLAASVCGSRCQTLQHTLMRCSPCVVLALGRLQPWWKESDAVHACGARHRVRVPSPTVIRWDHWILKLSTSIQYFN